MLLLFETPAGHALFEMTGSAQLQTLEPHQVIERLQGREGAGGIAESLKMKAFAPFKDTAEAVVAATEAVESKLGKPLKKFLTKHVVKNKDIASLELGVADAKLGSAIKEKLGISVVYSKLVDEALRGVRELVGAGEVLSVGEHDYRAMQLGLSHSLSRYKLKFSPDKVDTMVVQAVGLLDDLDKEVNTYAMRCREWYGWHFPELAKLLADNVHYAKVVKAVGFRGQFKDVPIETIAACVDDDEAIAATVVETAEISMGTEVDADDMRHIQSLADQVVELSDYRKTLAEYLRSRMQAIAPNLTTLVGELVGARLVQHAGSIMNLAKHPASTVQILGAEKALFRALKTKHDTPKYGLIYHASLIGQASPKNKGKISRVLAAKCALAARVDALGDDDGPTVGPEMRAKVEARLRQLEGGNITIPGITDKPKKRPLIEVISDDAATKPPAYSAASDMQALDDEAASAKKKKKRKTAEVVSPQQNGDDAVPPVADEDADGEKKTTTKKKKKKKSLETTPLQSPESTTPAGESSKKKKKRKAEEEEEEVAAETPVADDSTKKKKKKKKRKDDDDGPATPK